MLPSVHATIEKWYRTLKFPTEYDAEFLKLLDTVEVEADVSVETYEEQADGAKNLLVYLYGCEEVKQNYEKKGIDLTVLYDTLYELTKWAVYCTKRKGKLWLCDFWWIKKPMVLQLFRLGRLNFCMGEERHDLPQYALPKGAPILEVHIPRDGPLDVEECEAALAQARTFFATHFPDFHYVHMTCDSWLLDRTLNEMLSPESNILKFQQLFNIVSEKPSDEILPYVLGRPVTRETVVEKEATSSLARAVKQRALDGQVFYEGYGIVRQ